MIHVAWDARVSTMVRRIAWHYAILLLEFSGIQCCGLHAIQLLNRISRKIRFKSPIRHGLVSDRAKIDPAFFLAHMFKLLETTAMADFHKFFEPAYAGQTMLVRLGGSETLPFHSPRNQRRLSFGP
jgi:hypothetical protein